MWTREAEFRERLDRMVTSPTRSGLAELSDLAVDDQKWVSMQLLISEAAM